MSKKEVFTVRRVPRTWTSNKEYEICKGSKVVLKLGDRDEANEVCKYLNSFQPETRKQSKKKSVKKVKKENVEEVTLDE
ncbi:hypothetical protein [Methanobrevibacter sp.]|uniref:hypothetical protein n=1 Tax=Methanobrevibacter sp. TaxID=66852 RepID=UPI0038649D3B